MDLIPPRATYLVMTGAMGALFMAILWARNARFLWSRRRIIITVVLIAELWMLVTDPLGGQWGAWYFDPQQVLGIWLFGVTPVEDVIAMAVVSAAAACGVLVFGYSPKRWIW
ncbi:MAG: lycopene cyclase domain-containing protein [Chloroflexi bacterium]|nr:lycopene cyclase domain-containing protein [Chloroflexota bacterium]